MENNQLQQLRDILAKNDSFAIAVGRNPRIDEMAAALSWYLTLTSLNKKVSVVSPTDPIVELSSLVGIDKVKNSIESTDGDLVVAFPYREGEIEKVSYTIEEGFLNIVVKAGEEGLSFTQSDVQFKRNGGKVDVLFVIGTPRLSDLGDVYDPEKMKDTKIVNIDVKDHNQGFGDLVLVAPTYSSVSEYVTSLLMSLDMEFDIDVAQNLLSGITQATNNFQSPKTSSMAFEMAGILMRKGAVRTALRTQEVREPKRDDRSGFAGGQQFPRQQQPRQQQNFPRQQQQSQPVQQQNQPMQQQQPQDQGSKNPPSDWLTPKVYKGSSNV